MVTLKMMVDRGPRPHGGHSSYGSHGMPPRRCVKGWREPSQAVKKGRPGSFAFLPGLLAAPAVLPCFPGHEEARIGAILDPDIPRPGRGGRSRHTVTTL